MATQSEKLRMLKELDEATFRAEVLIPLLKKMKYKKVRERHGPDEYGKDITFCEPSGLGDMHCAVVAKVGDISGAASGKGILATIVNQINMAFEMPIEDVEERKKYQVGRVFVWTTGKYARNARRQIMDAQTEKYRNVVFKDGQATVELLEEYYPAFFTIRDPYVSEYFAAAREVYSRLEELRTLGCSSEQHRLPVIFVPPTLTPFENRQSVSKALVNPKVPDKKFRVPPREMVTFDELLEMSQNVVVVGIAGSGKSTLLRRMLLSIIERNEQAAQRSPIPILIEFKRLDIADEAGIETAINREFSRFIQIAMEQDLKTDLADGSMIVLLDGLDELKTEDRIIQALERVKEFNHKYPNTRIVMSSRLLEILETPGIISEFRILEIMRLTPEQMTKFVENWYGVDTPMAKKMAQVVRGPFALRGLPTTPLTLALVAILYESGASEIPANLTELFQKYTELALGRWDISRNISLQFEWKVKQFILQKISWDMHQQCKSEIGVDDFKVRVEHLASERGLAVDSGNFCDELVGRSELLYQNHDDQYEFKHRSFQDYFAGLEINSRADAADIAVTNFLDPWWSQAIFFAGGLRPGSEDYLKTIMDRVQVSAADYLFYIWNLGSLAQASYLAPKPIKTEAVSRVLDTLVEAWDYLCNHYADIDDQLEKPEAIKEIPTHVVFQGIFVAVAQATLGSFTLSPVLADLIQLYSSELIAISSDRERAKREWYVFLLAMSCARCDSIANFAKVFESGMIKDPSFLFWGLAQAEEIEKRAWLEQCDRARAEALRKKLGKKLKGYRDYLASLRNKEPMPLPPPDTLDIDSTSSETGKEVAKLIPR